MRGRPRARATRAFKHPRTAWDRGGWTLRSTMAWTIAFLTMSAAAPAAFATQRPVAEGTILVGDAGLGAFLVGDSQSVDGFTFDAPDAGTVLATRTIDRSGAGYALGMMFWSEAEPARGAIATCRSDTGEAACVVPEGAVAVTVFAQRGALLDVAVHTA